MSKMVQIRHLPDDIHKLLKLRTVNQGTSLSEYLVKELTLIAKTPLLEDVLDRIHNRDKVMTKEDSLKAFQVERATR